jgi:glycosyltransferase involved in cell wall biosynthesis
MFTKKFWSRRDDTLKAALIHDWLNGMRGGEKVLESFCDLYPDAPIFTLFYEPDCVSEKIRTRMVIPSVLQKFPLARRYYRHYLPLFPWAIRRFDLAGFDHVISISHCAAKGVRIPKGAVHICYCLTPMRYIWDKFDDYFGVGFSPEGAAMGLLRGKLRRWDVATSAGVNFFVATSRHIAEKIRVYFARESEVIPPPVDAEYFSPAGADEEAQEPATPKGEYYLIVSALVPYKRVDVAVEAFRGRRERLFIAGSGPEENKLRRNATDNVTFLGWVENDVLRELYRHCRALIFPQEEDFGIAPLEAMACGKPVVAYGRGGILDTVEEGRTGLFFREQTPESVRRALDSFRRDDFDPAVLRRHALKFTRENFTARWRAFLKEKAGVQC